MTTLQARKIALYQVIWDVAAGATNTLRPLTHSLDVTKEGLGVHASRRSDTDSARPVSTLTDFQLEFDYACSDPPKRSQGRSERLECQPFDGPESKWRQRAVQQCWTELGIESPALSWPTPMCGTPLCLRYEHLVWESPLRLDYPAGVCVYCGVIAGTKDHLLPRTWTGEAVRRKVLTVPACGECNSTISDRYAPSITERRAIAHGRIRKRKSRVINMPVWTEDEIAKLGAGLRSTILKGVHDQKLTLARLAWPDEQDYDLRAMQLSGIENPYELGLLLTPEQLAAMESDAK